MSEQPVPPPPGFAESLNALEEAISAIRRRAQSPSLSAAATGPSYEEQVEVAALMARIRGELTVAGQRLGSMTGWKVLPLPPPHAADLQLAPEPDPQGEPRNAEELLAMRDGPFVRAAFRALLGRDPDATGYAYFLARVRSGELTRRDALAELVRSAGQAGEAVRPLPGLGAALAGGRLARVPGLRWLGRVLTSIARLPNLASRLDRLENRSALAALDQRYGAEMRRHALHVNHYVWQLVDRVNALAASDNERRENVRRIAERMKALEGGLHDLGNLVREGAAPRELEALGVAARDAIAALEASQRVLQSGLREAREDAARAAGSLEATRRREAEAQAHRAAASEAINTAGRQIAALESGLRLVMEEDGRHRAAASDAINTAGRQIAALEDGLRRLMEEDGRHRAAVSESINSAGRQIADLTAGLHGFAAEARGQLKALESSLQEQRTALLGAASAPAAPGAAAPAELGALGDAFYADFERRFRGSREEIRARLGIYARRFQTLDPGPILDLGCGRGELVEVLAEAGLQVRGVDLNAVQVEDARKRGLDVTREEALAHLRTLPDASHAAICALHVVEHLPLGTLMALLSECHRVLRPGGLLVLETPNPENLLVGAWAFWLDPTHLKPVPAALLAYLAEYAGFGVDEVMRLNPFPEADRHIDPAQGTALMQLIDGPRDYAVVARRIRGGA